MKTKNIKCLTNSRGKSEIFEGKIEPNDIN